MPRSGKLPPPRWPASLHILWTTPRILDKNDFPGLQWRQWVPECPQLWE
jgi:hypothetical protein